MYNSEARWLATSLRGAYCSLMLLLTKAVMCSHHKARLTVILSERRGSKLTALLHAMGLYSSLPHIFGFKNSYVDSTQGVHWLV